MFQPTIAIHLLQFQLVPVDQALGLCDCLLLREHLADLHEGLVLGLWDDEIDVDGHGKTNAAEH